MRQSRGFNFNNSSLVREGFASVRSTLAGLAETGSAPPKTVRNCFLQPFHHFVVPLPLHRGGTNFPTTEVSFAYFSFQRKVWCLLFFSKEKYGQRKVRCVYINRYKKGREGDCGWRIGAAHNAKQKVSVQTPSLCPKIY